MSLWCLMTIWFCLSMPAYKMIDTHLINQTLLIFQSLCTKVIIKWKCICPSTYFNPDYKLFITVICQRVLLNQLIQQPWVRLDWQLPYQDWQENSVMVDGIYYQCSARMYSMLQIIQEIRFQKLLLVHQKVQIFQLNQLQIYSAQKEILLNIQEFLLSSHKQSILKEELKLKKVSYQLLRIFNSS